ncbi:hypothetical protein ASD65_13650 [Microbacterium sp. Root61]|uniref:DUF998 domain-containing protein n=1 Tax=Microbacterium sp. Root61 TaxID=1736570 RepID=UPI0006FE3B58|nr:DUF998 domain-containing protein [Microbacterium sp. Root61]KRA25351.1 hypothetical protein ASD65_13650 [Microbacterium sp. Root61]
MTTAPAVETRAARPLPASSEGFGSQHRSLESLSLAIAVIAFILAAAVALPVFKLQAAPISGEGSIGQYAAIASAVVAVLAFIAGRYVVRHPGRRLTVLDILDVAALAFAHAIIALLSWTLLGVILEHGFIGADVFPLPLLVLAGASAAVTAYVVFYSATHMDLQLLAVVLALFLVEGVIASMLTASNPEWWKDNLSALGMTNDISSLAFNLTLIIAGILVTTLARYATRDVPTTNPRGVFWVRLCLIIVGIFLALVGVFPVDQFFAIHNSVATGMVVAYGVLVVMMRRWIPGMPRAFATLGWAFLAVVVVLGVYFAIGVYTLTAVELVAGILIFTWIILFIRNAHALSADSGAADARMDA